MARMFPQKLLQKSGGFSVQRIFFKESLDLFKGNAWDLLLVPIFKEIVKEGIIIGEATAELIEDIRGDWMKEDTQECLRLCVVVIPWMVEERVIEKVRSIMKRKVVDETIAIR